MSLVLSVLPVERSAPYLQLGYLSSDPQNVTGLYPHTTLSLLTPSHPPVAMEEGEVHGCEADKLTCNLAMQMNLAALL